VRECIGFAYTLCAVNCAAWGKKGKVNGKTGLRPFRNWGSVLLFVCAAWILPLFLGCGQAPAPERSPGIAEEPRSASANPSNTAASAAAPSSDRYDLARDEDRGGHTLKKHVGRTDEQLAQRLRRERISAASTWTDRDAAETTVAQALRAEQGRINSWERRGYPRANMALHFDAGRSIGRSLRRGDSQTVDCTSAVIVLRADGPDSFFVLTTYPEARE